MRTAQEHGSELAMLRRAIVIEETMQAGVTRARVKCECRLEWYMYHALIDDRQLAAGLRFRADWIIAVSEPKVIADYGQTIAGPMTFSEQRMAARRRINSAHRSLRDADRKLVIVAVCGMDEWAIRKTMTLREGLDDLAQHYGLEKSLAP